MLRMIFAKATDELLQLHNLCLCLCQLCLRCRQPLKAFAALREQRSGEIRSSDVFFTIAVPRFGAPGNRRVSYQEADCTSGEQHFSVSPAVKNLALPDKIGISLSSSRRAVHSDLIRRFPTNSCSWLLIMVREASRHHPPEPGRAGAPHPPFTGWPTGAPPPLLPS